MWFVRSLLFFAVSCVFLQHHAVQGWTTPDRHIKIVVSDAINTIWAKMLEQGISLSKYVVEDMSREGRGLSTSLTDEDIDKVVAVVSAALPDKREVVGRSRGLDALVNVIYTVAEYLTNLWRNIKLRVKDRVDSFMDWSRLLTRWYYAPLEVLYNFLYQPVTGRATAIDAVFDFVNKIWIVPTRNLFAAIVNIPADLMRNAMKLAKGSKTSGTARSLVESGLRQMKDEFMKFSLDYSGNPKTIYGQKHHRILKELSSKNYGVVNEAMNLLVFSIWSATGFKMVYDEIIKECYSDRDTLDYTLVDGETYVEDSYLHVIIDNANAKRDEACKFYKSEMGENAKQAYSFVADRFTELMETTYDHMKPVSADVVIVDAVAQSMLGTVEPVCMLRLLCMAGFSSAYETKHHPGVDLLLGIVVSGRTNFGGMLNQEHLQKLGTPKMAEAIYRGSHKDCEVYSPPRTRDCSNIDMFLMEFEPQPVVYA